MARRWMRWKRRQLAAHWREDARRGFLLGLAVASPLLAWAGLG